MPFIVESEGRLPAGFTTGAAVSAEAATPTAEAAAATEAAALFAGLGLRLVHAHGASVEFVSVQRVNRGLRLSGVGHRDEAESLAATGHAIGDNANGGNFAECRERRLETIVGRRVREVTNIDFRLDLFLLFLSLPEHESTRLLYPSKQIVSILRRPRQ